ncbi:SHIPPO 1-like protein [Spironucleus salmonicida]|uniref:SHIPPO 1-like protein n=1 Tax=Spironucleus salmonicida TaxID=348837 RepID=V6LFM0_9EUKA|nr:SHIPPO 1-like protein [Spironucleus salmonicida]|eukprot:EST43292.1 SHIPPO 1-like protein [Spironucleus salmonicida]
MSAFTSTQQIADRSIKPSPADSNTLDSYKNTSAFRRPPAQSISTRNSLSNSLSTKNLSQASPADANLRRSLSGKVIFSTTKRVQIKPQTPVSVGPGSYQLPSCFSQKSSTMSFKYSKDKLKTSGELNLSGTEYHQLSNKKSAPSYTMRQRPKAPENINPGPNKYEVKNDDSTNSRIQKAPVSIIPRAKSRDVFRDNSNPGVGQYEIREKTPNAGFTMSGRNYRELERK